MPSVKQSLQIIKNMGARYTAYRIRLLFQKMSGSFKRKFPQNPPIQKFISLSEWRKMNLFWGIQQSDKFDFQPSTLPDFTAYHEGRMPFFSSSVIDLGKEYDWVTNPDTGYRYNAQKHWSEIQDYSKEAGDIKYVWEKSRFAYLYDIIRHDFYTKEDHSVWVFSEIESWLRANKINSGPNYKCSQEISLRVLNWTYALHYYKQSPSLTEERFQEIIHAIYWQLKHVYDHINFSRIAVRNNHAITETLMLYLGGLFYPFFPEALKWKKQGKKWFEQEIRYQVYSDGTFLQFSMNYHRVVIQLLSWALKSADFFDEQFSSVVYDRAYKSLNFLLACQDERTGWLPNYGSNDGALFFKLNACDFRDYRPQLNVLHVLLTGDPLYEDKGDWQEDIEWMGAKNIRSKRFEMLKPTMGWSTFDNGGYFVLRERETLTFIRCGSHKDRPAQADNLHIDIWHKGKNVLFDGGSYKYNTDEETLKYFMGTASHNAVMLDTYDQMLKGPRFIWYNWSQCVYANTSETENDYVFVGEIKAFSHVAKNITHKRLIRKRKNSSAWYIEDVITHKPDKTIMCQYWHKEANVSITCGDKNEQPVFLEEMLGWRSNYYGVKENAPQFVAKTNDNFIKTWIEVE